MHIWIPLVQIKRCIASALRWWILSGVRAWGVFLIPRHQPQTSPCLGHWSAPYRQAIFAMDQVDPENACSRLPKTFPVRFVDYKHIVKVYPGRGESEVMAVKKVRRQNWVCNTWKTDDVLHSSRENIMLRRRKSCQPALFSRCWNMVNNA